MNLIKTLRKPYISIFLASLMLFISCNGNEVLDEEQNNAEFSKFDFSFLRKIKRI